MKSVKQTFVVEKLSKMNARKGLDFNFVIQRKENIWDLKRKSMLIHSILTDFPIPALYATKNGRSYSFIDGKQRLTCVLDYINGGFSLDKTTTAVSNTEIAEKKFESLPESFQKKLLEHKFEIYRIDEATMDELEELFYRLNNGMPLKRIETTRAILGGKLLLYIEDIANTPFFQKKINVSKSARQRFVDQELVLQILSLIHNRQAGFSGREIEAFVKDLRKKELQSELVTKMQNVCYYLNEAFPKKEKFLRKLHIPMLFMLALENQEKAKLVSPQDFGEWATRFFEEMPESYFNASQSGSAKKDNVQKRISIMKSHHDNHFTSLPTKNEESTESLKHTDSLNYVMQEIEKESPQTKRISSSKKLEEATQSTKTYTKKREKELEELKKNAKNKQSSVS